MKLNTKRARPRTHEKGLARHINAKEQLRRSLMACMLWENEFYEEGQSIAERIHSAAAECSPEYVSQLAIDARQNHGLRHAPLWLAMSLIPRGGKIAGDTLAAVINRPDELTEALAMYWKDGKRPLSAQLKRGLAEAFTKFDGYRLAKYNRNNEIKLRDVMFLVHPKAKDAEQEKVFKALADGNLESPDTWEVALSGGADKRETFTRLLAEKKLGYLALLRNLRNMVDAGVSKKLIAQALSEGNNRGILPFQYVSAAQACPRMEPDLDTAMQKSLAAADKLPGTTVVLVDVSGSMEYGNISKRSVLTRIDGACALAALITGVCDDARVFSFSNQVVEVPPRKGMALIDAVKRSQRHSGTALGAAVQTIDSQVNYDRLIVVTDEQSNDRVPNPKGKGYMINVSSYENGVGYGPWTHINGFSEKVIDYVRESEVG